MFCNKCGTSLPEESIFCIKCGTAVEIAPPSDQVDSDTIEEASEETKQADIAPAPTASAPASSKSKIKLFIGIAVLAVIIFIVYFFFYSKAVDDATDLYNDGEYNEAEERIAGYFPLSKNDYRLFNQIKIMHKCHLYMNLFEMYANSEFIEKNMREALRNLLQGYEESTKNKDAAEENDIGYMVDSLRSDYLFKLLDYYDISEETANELIKLDFAERSTEIEKLYQKGETASSQKKSEQQDREYREQNPLEFSGLGLSSNSSYTILEGTATNVSGGTLEFIKVKGLFQDSNNKVLDTDWTYAVGGEGLAPGESKKFRLSVTYDSRISTASVELN